MSDNEADDLLSALKGKVASQEVDVSGVLASLKNQLDAEISAANGAFKDDAKQLKDQALALGEMAKEAGANADELKANTAALKQDLDAFQQRFGSLGESFGKVVKGGLNKILPLPL